MGWWPASGGDRGREQRSRLHAPEALESRHAFSASPVAAEGRVYFQNETGSTFVLKAGKTFEQIAKNDIGDATLASIAVADGTIYLRSEKALRKITR